MERLRPVLRYCVVTVSAAISGNLFSLAMENRKKTQHKNIYVTLTPVKFSPFGAWVISTFGWLSNPLFREN